METIQQLIAVFFVLGSLALLLWLLKKRSLLPMMPSVGNQAKKRVAVLERTSLTPQHALHLVRVGDEMLLLATHSSGTTVLKQVPAAALPEREISGAVR